MWAAGESSTIYAFCVFSFTLCVFSYTVRVNIISSILSIFCSTLCVKVCRKFNGNAWFVNLALKHV